MLLQELKSIKSGKRELRQFGLTVGIILAVLGAIFFYKHKPKAPLFTAIGVFLILFGYWRPLWLKPLQKVWMGFAVIMGFFVSRIILTILFYFILTPLAIFAKLFGKDFLSLKIYPQARTYWKKREDKEFKKEDYERQF